MFDSGSDVRIEPVSVLQDPTDAPVREVRECLRGRRPLLPAVSQCLHATGLTGTSELVRHPVSPRAGREFAART